MTVCFEFGVSISRLLLSCLKVVAGLPFLIRVLSSPTCTVLFEVSLLRAGLVVEPLAGFAFTGVMNSGWLLSAAGPVCKLSALASLCCS